MKIAISSLLPLFLSSHVLASNQVPAQKALGDPLREYQAGEIDEVTALKKALRKGRADLFDDLLKLPDFQYASDKDLSEIISDAVLSSTEFLNVILKDGRFDDILLTKDMLFNFAEAGNAKAVQYWLQRINITIDFDTIANSGHEAFRAAIRNGDLETFNVFMEHEKNTAVQGIMFCHRGLQRLQNVFELICQFGNVELLSHFLSSHPEANPGAKSNTGIIKASGFGKTKIVEFLLNDKRVDPSACDNITIKHACSMGNLDIVKMLLKDDRVNISLKLDTALLRATHGGHFEILKLLLEDPSADVLEIWQNRIFQEAFDKNNIEIFKMLLADSRFHPRNQLFANACGTNGKTEIIKLLAKDPRVDPADGNNLAFFIACKNSQIDAVKLLLADERIDPSGQNNEPLFTAVKNHEIEIIKILLKDKRVDPTARNNSILSKVKNIQTACTLLSDSRVSIPDDGDFADSRILNLYEMLQHVRNDDHQSLPRYIAPGYIDLLAENAIPFSETARILLEKQICWIKLHHAVRLEDGHYTCYMKANEEDREKIRKCFFEPLERLLPIIRLFSPRSTAELDLAIELLLWPKSIDCESIQGKSAMELIAILGDSEEVVAMELFAKFFEFTKDMADRK